MIAVGDIVVATSDISDPDGEQEFREGARGMVIGFQGDDPIVDFGYGPFSVFPVDKDRVEVIRRPPAVRRKP